MTGASTRMEGVGNNSSILAAMMRESWIVSPFGKLTAGMVNGGILGLMFGVVPLDVLSADLVRNTRIGMVL
jgi:hypothetical protein